MKNKKLLSKTIVTLTLFFISFTIFLPISTANPLDNLYVCEPVFDIEWDEKVINEPISPYSEPKNIPIIIKAKIRGVLQHIVGPKYGISSKFFIYLYIEETPEWSKVTVNPPLVKINVSQDWVSTNATLSITLDKDSPAFETSNIKIRVESRRMGNKATVVPEGNKTFEMPFTVGYVPLLAINELEGNHKVITPDDTANFPIELINLGNGKTDVKTEVLSKPDGWQVEVISETSLGVKYLGENYRKTLNVAIKPPYGFGYHEDREVIELSITPISNKYSNITGESHVLTFVVHSKGFSTPGFEGIFVIFSIVIILFIVKKKYPLSKKRFRGEN